MKAKVIKRFRDKDTEVIHPVDTFYESNEARVKELQENGFLDSGTIEPKQPSLLDGNVGKVTESITDELGNEKLQELLQQETEGANRKGVKDHIESLLSQE